MTRKERQLKRTGHRLDFVDAVNVELTEMRSRPILNACEKLMGRKTKRTPQYRKAEDIKCC